MGLNSCSDAQRDNPLDPHSPLYRNVGSIEGEVTSFYPPHRALPNVEVHLTPLNWWTYTDDRGIFAFQEVPEGRYWITARGQGYAVDSLAVVVKPQQSVQAILRLDGIPVISDARILSVHISRWWPPPEDIFLLEMQVEVDDPDGLSDITGVWVEVSDSTFLDSLRFDSDRGYFYTSLEESDLPTSGIHELLGLPFRVLAQDAPGVRGISEPYYLARVIDFTPQPLSPYGLEAVPPKPELIWAPVVLPFQFTLVVEVSRIDLGIPTPVWRKENLPPTTTRLALTDSLAPGTYFWTVSVVDSFGNRSRSKEASFRVL